MKPGAFARSVAGRHGAARGRLSRPSLVLLGPRRQSPHLGTAAARHVHHHRSVRVTLNFRQLETGHRRSTVVHSTTHAAPLPPRIVARTTVRTISSMRVERHVPVPGRATAGAASTQALVLRRSPIDGPKDAGRATARDCRSASDSGPARAAGAAAKRTYPGYGARNRRARPTRVVVPRADGKDLEARPCRSKKR